MSDVTPDEANKAGQPTKYKEEYNKQAYKLCLLGSTDKDLADFFEVSESTINNWKNEHPKFLESIKKGKNIADANVADRLYQRAMGYEHKEDKIFNNQGEPLVVPTVKYHAPDTTAAIFWLKNRQLNASIQPFNVNQVLTAIELATDADSLRESLFSMVGDSLAQSEFTQLVNTALMVADVHGFADESSEV